MPARAVAHAPACRRGQRDGAVAPAAAAAREREQHLVRLEVVALQPGQARRGACSYSSAIATSSPPRASSGSDSSASASTSSTRSRGWASARPVERRDDERQRGGLERRDADRAADLAGVRRELGLDLLDVAEQLVAAGHERPACVGELEPAARLAEQLDADLALQLRELLETADGVNASASAAPAIVPWAANSRSTASRRGLSIG